MLFSSLVFICIFLPVTLILYWLMPSIKVKNIFLLLASLLFYAYGEPVYIFLMIISSLMNYIWAILIDRYDKHKKLFLVFSVVGNIGILVIFKYTAFLVGCFNSLTGADIAKPHIALPVGISFFTFQAMSYVIDVYRGETRVQRNFLLVLLYISFFPQLIAGPIVKYHDIAEEISERVISTYEISNGIRRFTAGLGKKVLIADSMGAVVDTLYGAPGADINILTAWIAAAAYILQIYFDFSGYSDMAIGLGRMFGFHFKENFNYPYIASNIREFWRRWHISLTTWFKEYLYIPLGGNRKGRFRTVINKFIVFASTGIWHGANVTFLVWGLFHGFFLMLEEYVPFIKRDGGFVKRIFNHIYVLLVVIAGFVIFRSDNMGQALFWFQQMFTGIHFDNPSMRLLMSVLTPANIAVFAAGIILSMPVKNIFAKRRIFTRLSWPVSFLVLILCMMSLGSGTYNPFIYFKF